jgi:hypothetical protein
MKPPYRRVLRQAFYKPENPAALRKYFPRLTARVVAAIRSYRSKKI